MCIHVNETMTARKAGFLILCCASGVCFERTPNGQQRLHVLSMSHVEVYMSLKNIQEEMVRVGQCVCIQPETVLWYCRPTQHRGTVEIVVTEVEAVTDTSYVAAFHRFRREELRLHIQGCTSSGYPLECWTTDESILRSNVASPALRAA